MKRFCFWLTVFAVLFWGLLGSCATAKPPELKPKEGSAKVKTVAEVTHGDGWFEFHFDTLDPVQDDGAFNRFLFPDLDPAVQLLWAEGYAYDTVADGGKKIPSVSHRAGFTTYGESIDIMAMNPDLPGEYHEVWITTNDTRAPGYKGRVRVYYAVKNGIIHGD
jgi:hypothetical protein